MNLRKNSKKLFLLSALMLAGTGQAFAVERLLGDVNGDGRVNVADVDGIIGHILNRPAATFDETAANVNGDAKINVADYDGVLNIILTKTIGRNGTSSLKFARSAVEKANGAAAFTVDIYRAGSTGAITYVSSAPGVVSVDASTGEMTVRGVGTATITATLAAGGSCSEATATLTVTVSSGDSIEGYGNANDNPWIFN